jgi:hypothetical protein
LENELCLVNLPRFAWCPASIRSIRSLVPRDLTDLPPQAMYTGGFHLKD